MNIDENIPLDDEDFGGFEATSDDDSFALEHLDDYPGDLSQFKESAISLEKSAENALRLSSESASQIATEEKSQYRKQIIEDDNEQSQRGSASYRNALGEDDDATGIPFKRSGAIDDDNDLSQFSSSRETLSPKDTAESIAKPVEQVFEKVDDEWVRLLKQDVERSKERKSPNGKQSETEQLEQSPQKKEFTSVEDLGSTEEIDLGDIEAHHPSTYHLQEQEELNVSPQPELESFPDDEQASSYSYATMAAEMASASEPTVEPVVTATPIPTIPKPTKPRNKKRRKQLVFFMVGAVAIAAAGYGAFLFYPTITAFLNPSPSEPIPLATNEPPKVHPKVEEHVKDSVHAEGSEAIDSVESHDPPALSEVLEPEKKEATAHSAPASEKSIDIPHNKTEPTHQIPKKLEPVITKTASSSKTVTHNNTSASSSETAQQIFTVQVYSSPSKDDANERLERLKSRNATNISMSEQLIRGTKWYRVRFGSFNSREEAESAAKQLGFAQCWIDRVR